MIDKKYLAAAWKRQWWHSDWTTVQCQACNTTKANYIAYSCHYLRYLCAEHYSQYVTKAKLKRMNDYKIVKLIRGGKKVVL